MLTMSSRAWQHPYVNVFKHVKLEEWKKANKEGDVTTYMMLKCSVFRIRGSIPASNFILLPKTSSQSLGLTGRYFYLLFRPTPNKHFVVHLDVAAEEGQVIRVSFSNLFKEFKSTATWLQFPLLCGAASGSVYESTAKTAKDGLVGPTPASVRWTCLVMDLRYVLSIYLNRTHSHLKSIRLCANMVTKNVITSDLLLDPGLSFSEFRQAGMVLSEGTAPMPREMCFPVPKGSSWHDLYDYIRFPSDGTKMPFDSIQKGLNNPPPKELGASEGLYREESRCVSISKNVQDRVSLIQQITTPKPRARQHALLLTSSLPELTSMPFKNSNSPRLAGLGSQGQEEDNSVTRDDGDGVHVFAHCNSEDDVTAGSTDNEEVAVVNAAVPQPLHLASTKPAKQRYKLHPDPILKLNKIIGFGGATMRCAAWAHDGEEVVYPCHAIIVSMKVLSGHQRFFIGHTDKVSALALNTKSSLLASAQTGTHCVVRLWSYSKGQCLTMIKTHTHSLHSLSFSYSGGVLCGVGKDTHNRTMVVVWNTQHVPKGGVASVIAKAHTDVDIQTMKIAFFDDTRMVSCGMGNVRLWRVRGSSLRSCPVNLGEYHSLEFTDLDFEQGHTPDRPPDDRALFASSRSGHILDIDYVSVAIKNVRRLLPAQQSHAHRREKQTFNTGPGIAVNSISVCGAFCATGSEDGFLRLWPLDFSSVFLEAEHEGPLSLVHVSSDGLSVLAATSTGNLGYLDVSSRGYRTLMRSHTATVLGFSVDGVQRQITTASKDCTVRVWAMDSAQQLYDFVSEEDNDAPCSVAFHPSLPVFACGSNSGAVRVFDIPTSSLQAQHRQHRGPVVGVLFSPDGNHLYSACSLGHLALYSTKQPDYHILRVLGNVVARGMDRGPGALAVSSDSRHLAFVGPTEYTVTIMDAHSLDELLRIDVSVLDVESTTLDSALRVCFSPSAQLLVTTSANKILWINSSTGRLLREVSKVHKHQCSSLAVSKDGRYLLTAGHTTVKVWDYNMKLDINSQVFIGHSEPITQVIFTPDQMGVVSVGDAVFFWDFLAHPQEMSGCRSPTAVLSPPRPCKGRMDSLPETGPRQSKCQQSKTEFNGILSNGEPRLAVPRPFSSPPVLDVSAAWKAGHGDSSFASLSSDIEELQPGPIHSHDPAHSSDPTCYPAPRHASFLRIIERTEGVNSISFQLANQVTAQENGDDSKPIRPDCYKHFKPCYRTSTLDQSAVAPPPGQEGLTLKAVVGYNGNGRSNMAWNPDTGLFVYSCGCVVVVENLQTGSQRHWLGHTEEISTLAVTHDAQMVASASGGGASSKSLICIWNVQDGSHRNSISYHKGSVQSLAFSRDDLYFLSVGDCQEPGVALWSTCSFELLCTVNAHLPLHEAAFSPSSTSQLAYAGNNAVFFCCIHTRGRGAELQVKEVELPSEIGEAEVTCLCYTLNSILFTGTNGGRVCVWDCNTHRCFMTWEADDGEIGVMFCHGNRLVTGSNTKKLRLWSVAAVQNLRPSNSGTTNQQGRNTQVLLEQEMILDGTVVSVAFDDVLDMGIVGTTAGTLWYINWPDNTSIRLISGHKSKVNGVVCSPDEQHFVTCGQDGSVRVWALPNNELLVQFQVLNQSCECVCWGPMCVVDGGRAVAGGYSDGFVRIFSVAQAQMKLRLQPQRSAVCALQYSEHGQVLLSGGRDGCVVVSCPITGVTLRIFNDHKGAPITTIQCTDKQYKEFGLEGNELWLAVSVDRRVSIWAADWTKDKCELLDWLTFPAPSPPEDAASLPPSVAAFSPERGVVVYTGYAAQKELTFYCLKKKQVLRTVSLTDWALSLSPCVKGKLLVTGSNQRVLKLIDTSSGRFQDFMWHSDSVHLCSFSPSGTRLFTAAHSEVFLWTLVGL
ncbi:WD repeat-containing protein 90 isoform X2 [Electrophorus electricus]|uniref:WD repeat-containing protein 90 isoform X2 n=1 Tax=Electrophorus electricus TaxID=8005 RepID=UPI0015D07E59|nr:WD repeat-containing protein 90 isoform X2 [Electrophorus electricus]